MLRSGTEIGAENVAKMVNGWLLCAGDRGDGYGAARVVFWYLQYSEQIWPRTSPERGPSPLVSQL